MNSAAIHFHPLISQVLVSEIENDGGMKWLSAILTHHNILPRKTALAEHMQCHRYLKKMKGHCWELVTLLCTGFNAQH